MSSIFSVVHVTTVAEGVLRAEGGRKGAAHGKDIAPGIVGVGNNGITIGAIYQGNNVTLKILDIVIELGCCRTRAGVGHLTYPGGGRVLSRAVCIAVGTLVRPVCHGGQAA